jgi:predicted short-subunit dehydrogenase-like oxidoreductase (DUF2520 family)
MKSVVIVGAGRLGTVLGAALRKKGFVVRAIVDRRLAAARESRKIIGAGTPTRDAARAAAGADIVIVAIPDGETAREACRLAKLAGAPVKSLGGLAKAAGAQRKPGHRLAKLAGGPGKPWRGKIVFHTSGVLAADVLAPLRNLGAACASFHPVQSFPRKDLPAAHFKGVTIGLEGDARAVRAGAAIARKLGARPRVFKGADKALYHAACSVASNLLVPLFDTACGLLRESGIGDREAVEMLWPLAEGTLRSVKRLDRASALTGPISRGDVETVRRHLRALEKFPAARKIYRVLGAEALRLARRPHSFCGTPASLASPRQNFPSAPASLASPRAKILPRDLRALARMLGSR